MSKSIEAIIKKDGTITVETVGYKGKSCDDALKFINGLGDVMKTEDKPERFEPSPEPNVQIKR